MEIESIAPVYHLYVDGNHVANLSDPESEDMFWYSYLVTPISSTANAVLLNKKTWELVDFTIKDKDGNIPNPNTFSGGYDSFCRGATNRLSFRSLVPQNEKSYTLLQRISLWWRQRRR